MSYSALLSGLNPCAYWRLGDGVGNPIAVDLVGNYDATVNNGGPDFGETGLVINDANTCAFFNTTQYLTTTYYKNQQPNGSVVLLVNTADSLATFIQQYNTGANNIDMLFGMGKQTGQIGCAGGILNFEAPSVYGTNWIQSTFAINDSKTHHIVLTVEGSTYSLYIDGILNVRKTGQPSSGIWGSIPNTPIRISGIKDFVGFMDELALYDEALSQETIKELYRSSKGYDLIPTTYKDQILHHIPIGYWKLDDDIGSSVAIDETGRFDGTYTGCQLQEKSLVVNDPQNRSIYTNGISDYVSLTPILSTLKNYSTGSVSFITSFPSGGSGAIYFYDDSSDDVYITYEISEGEALFQHVLLGGEAERQRIRTYREYEPDTLYHLCFVQDDDEGIIIYVNGQKEPTYQDQVAPILSKWWDDSTGIDGIAINAILRPSAVYTKSYVDEVAFFTEKLTSEDVKTLYNLSIAKDVNPSTFKDLVLYHNPITYLRLGDEPAVSMDDDFTGNNFDLVDADKWRTTQPVTTGTIDTYIFSDKVRTSIVSGQSYGYLTNNSKLTGDFDIQVDFNCIENSNARWSESLTLSTADTNNIAGGDRVVSIGRFGYSTDGPYRSQVLAAGTAVLAGSADASGKLRIVRVGSVVTTYYFDVTWIAVQTDVMFTNDDVFAIISVGSWHDNKTVTLEFDNFVLTSGTIIPGKVKEEVFDEEWYYFGNVDNTSGLVVDDVNKSAAMTSDRSRVYPINDIELDETDFSISALVQIDTKIEYHTIFYRRQTEVTEEGIIFGVRNTGVVNIYLNDGTNTTDLSSTETNKDNGGIHHLVVTVKKSGNVTLYDNGKEVAQTTNLSTGSLANTSRSCIGNHPNDTPTTGWDYLRGAVDEFAVFNKELTALEVEAIYNKSIAYKEAPTTYREQVVSLTPLSYWRLGESAGTVANDEMGNNTGEYINAPALGYTGLLVGDNDTCMDNAATSFVTALPITPAKPAISVSCLVNLDAVAQGRGFFGDIWGGISPNARILLGIWEDKWWVIVGNGSAGFMDNTSILHNLSAGKTYHITYVVDGFNIKIYVNNFIAAEYTSTVSIGTAGQFPWYIGKDGSGGKYLDGRIDEVAFYEYALTYENVKDLCRFSKNITDNQTYNDVVLQNMPIAYWRLGETAGLDAFDEIGDYDCTYENSPLLGATGLIDTDSNTAVGFDGTDNYLESNNKFAYHLTYLTKYSVSLIYKPRDISSSSTLIGSGASSNSTGFILYVNNLESGVMRFGCQVFRDVSGTQVYYFENSTLVEVGKTYHVVLTVNGSNGASITINGLKNTGTLINSLSTNDSDYTLNIGRYNYSTPGGYAKGIIDEVALYGHVLNDIEIQELYNKYVNANDYKQVQIKLDHQKIDEDLFDFPLLLNLDTNTGFNDVNLSSIFDYTETDSPNDSFDGVDGTLPDPDKWLDFTTALNPTNPMMEIQDGMLYTELTSSVNDHDTVSMYSNYRLVGDFDIRFDSYYISDPTDSFLGMNIIDESGVRSSFNQYYSNRYLITVNGGGNVIKTRNEDVCGLRFVRTGTTIEFFKDEQLTGNWTSIHSGTVGTSSVKIGFVVYSWHDGNTASGYFNNLQIEADDIIWDEGNIDKLSRLNVVYQKPEDKISNPVSADDDFTGNNLDAPNEKLWYYHEGIESYVPCIIKDNQLTSSTIASSWQERSFATSTYTIDGDFDIQVDISCETTWKTNEAGYIFILPIIEGNIYNFIDQIVIYRWTNTLKWYGGQNGASIDDITNGNITNNSFKLRMTRTGDTFIGYLDDGAGWVEKFNKDYSAQSFSQIVKVGLSTGNTTLYNIKLNNFVVNSGTVVWESPDDNTVNQQCKVEINRWDQINKQAQLWVKVPYISKDADTYLNFSFDNTDSVNTNNIGKIGTMPAKQVWNTYDNVYHLSENGNDSTYLDIDETASNIDVNDIVDSDVGKGLDFNGTDEYISWGDNHSVGLKDWWFSCKFNASNISASDQIVYSKSQSFNSAGRILISLQSTGKLYFRIGDSTKDAEMTSNKTFAIDTNYTISYRLERSNKLKLYVDGVLDIETDFSNMVNEELYIACPSLIGTYSDATCSGFEYSVAYKGMLQEMRFSNELKTETWAKLDSQSSTDNLSILSYVDEAIIVPDTESFEITIDSTKISEDLYDFPVLLNLGYQSGINNDNTTKPFQSLNPDLTGYNDFTGDDYSLPDPMYWTENLNDGEVYLFNNKIRMIANDERGQVQSYFVVRGDFDIRINYDMQHSLDGDNVWYSRLKLVNDDDKLNIVLFGRRHDDNNDDWFECHLIDYSNNQANNNISYHAVVGQTTSAFRLVRVGTEVEYYYDNSGTWVLLRTVTWYDNDVIVRLEQRSHDGKQIVTDFSNLQVVTGEVIWKSLPKPVFDKFKVMYLDQSLLTHSPEYYKTIMGYNPVGYWRLGESSGTSAIDEINTQHGTYNGGVTLSANGLIDSDGDKSAYFNGTNDYVGIPHNAIYNSNNQSYSFIIETPSSIPGDSKGILFKAPDTGYNREISIVIYTSGSLSVTISNGTNQTVLLESTSSICDGGIYHVVVTKEYNSNGDIITLYLNGEYNNSVQATFNSAQNTNEICIGRLSSNSTSVRYYIGRIDEVAIFNSILSPTQARNLYQQAKNTQAAIDTIDEQVCYLEIDRWDHENKQAQIWVNVPYISANVDTKLNFSFNQNNDDNSAYTGITGTTPAQKVWDSYVAVYHLSKDGSDSASDPAFGNFFNMDYTNVVDFGIGKGLYFNGTNDYLDMGVQEKFNLNIQDEFILEHYFQLDGIVTSNYVRGLQNRGSGAGATGGFQFSYRDSDRMATNTTFAQNISNYNTISATPEVVFGEQKHSVLMWEKSTPEATLYENGEKVTSPLNTFGATMDAAVLTSARNTTLGCAWDSSGSQSQFWEGIFKEVRFARSKKSESWIKANTKSITDELVSFKTEETAVDILLDANTYEITIDHRKIDEDLYNFPILINLGEDVGQNNQDTTDIFNVLNKSKPASAEAIYWRIYVTETNNLAVNGCIISEIEFHSEIGGNDVSVPITSGSLVTASSYVNVSNQPYYAFDDLNLANQWSCDQALPQWIQYDTNGLGSIAVKEVAITCTVNTSQQQYMIKDFIIQSSNDGVIWKDELSVVGETDWNKGEVRLFEIPQIVENNTFDKVTVTYISPESQIRPDNINDLFTGNDGDKVNRNLWNDISGGTAITEIRNNKLYSHINGTPNITNIKSLYDFDGDFDIQIDTELVNFNTDHSLVSLVVLDDIGNYWSVFFKYDTSQSISNLQINCGYGTTSSFTGEASAEMVNASGQLRLVRIGTTVYYKYNIGSGWIDLFTSAASSSTNMRISLTVKSMVSAAVTVVKLNNFVHNSGNYEWRLPADSSTTQFCFTEIDKWDQEEKSAHMWVRVPYISKDVDTKLHVAYDVENNSNVGTLSETGGLGAQQVWTGYDAVYHLSSDATDSTSYGNDGTLINMDESNIIDFGIGTGLEFNGTDEWIDFGLNSHFDLEIGDSFHVEHTLDAYTLSNYVRGLQNRGTGEILDYAGFQWSMGSTGKITNFHISDGNTGAASISDSYAISSNTRITSSTSWNRSDNDISYVVNGVDELVTESITGTPEDSIFTSSRNTTIGCGWQDAGTQSQFFDGVFKEIRFSKSIKSVAWSKANYHTIEDDLLTYSNIYLKSSGWTVFGVVGEETAIDILWNAAYNITLYDKTQSSLVSIPVRDTRTRAAPGEGQHDTRMFPMPALPAAQIYEINGTAKVNGSGTQCIVYIFNKQMQMVDSFLSESDGSFTTKNIHLTHEYNIVVKSLTGECPQISGLLSPSQQI